MIREIYKDINKAFKNNNYYQVINLINYALKMSKLGLDQEILFKYGYSLLKVGNIEEGINVLRIITNLTKFSIVEQYIINNYEKKQNVNLALDEYLKQYELEAGLVVNVSSKPFLIWKVSNNRVYAFKIENNKHGIRISGSKYFIDGDLAFSPNLVKFDIKDIDSINFKLDDFDYKRVINDLLERNCIFGNIAHVPKNIFIREMERKLDIKEGDIITVFDVVSHHNRFYYIISIDENARMYKTVAITHEQGYIKLKNNEIIDISFDTFISGKNVVALDYKKRLAEEVASLETSSLKR